MKISSRNLLIGIIIVVIGGWYFFGGSNKEDKKSPLEDITARVTRRDIQYDLIITGEIAPGFQMDVKSEVGGKVKSIFVVPGQFVKKGEPFAEIDDTDLRTQQKSVQKSIEGAQLQMDKSKGNYERAKKLFEAKLISKEVYVNLESDYEISKNALEIANQGLQAVMDQLNKTRILADSDGTVLSIPITPSQVIIAAASVNSGTTLLTFADLSKLIINTHVNQMDVEKISVNQKIFVSVTQEEAALTATVKFIAPLATAKNNIKGFDIQAEVLDPQHLLKPGITVRMRVPVADVKNALSVPIAAVFRDGTDHVVYIRNGETTTKRKVKIGVMDMAYAQIISGVKEGEEVLLVEPKNIKS
ncbi:MAG: efflux RND transporter periplasmic adaptor subunit [Chthoniobacterales bacterium]